MIKISVRGQVSILDTKLLTKVLAKQLEIEFKNAIREWLKAVLDEIPAYTATSRGTFRPLGRVLRTAVPEVGRLGAPGTSANASRKKYFYYQGAKYPLGFKQGEAYSDHDLTIDYGLNKIDYRFSFSNYLPYFVWNDAIRAPSWLQLRNPTPWKALDAGAKAWENYVKNINNKIGPSLTAQVKVMKVK